VWDRRSDVDSETVSTDFITRGARTEHLLSKLIAGGLSAGVVLLWWPRVFQHDSAGAWVTRGIAWTLLAEILVVAVSPLEHVLRARIGALRPVGHVRSFLSASSRLRAYCALALAAIAVSLPLMLIATGQPAAEPPQPQRVTKVTRVVKVVKQVKVKRIIVREAAPAARSYPRAVIPAPVVTPAPVATSAPAAPKPAAPKRTAPAKHQQQTAAKDKPATPTPAPSPTTTPATPTPAPGA
jgi:hypothetical protein